MEMQTYLQHFDNMLKKSLKINDTHPCKSLLDGVLSNKKNDYATIAAKSLFFTISKALLSSKAPETSESSHEQSVMNSLQSMFGGLIEIEKLSGPKK